MRLCRHCPKGSASWAQIVLNKPMFGVPASLASVRPKAVERIEVPPDGANRQMIYPNSWSTAQWPMWRRCLNEVAELRPSPAPPQIETCWQPGGSCMQ
jgi:hypothetical protein